ncbi:MAG: hypothetical protein WCR76_05560 [Sphaerochaetaceae bacterium]
MALFLANAGLGCLMRGKNLDETLVLPLLERSTRSEDEGGGAYYTCLMDSGLELVFRVQEREDGLEMMGLDTHMGGRCVWTASPVVSVGKPEYLGMQLLLADPGQRNAFVMGFVRPALLRHLDTDSVLEIQVSAFPTGMDVYDSRESFEAMIGEENRLLDRQILPYYYVMAREESTGKKMREFSKRNEMINLFCGPVLAMEERENGYLDTKLMVSTVATSMGHIDVVYARDQLSKPAEKGTYLMASAYFSGDVLSVRGKMVS